jgi:hypothetical protein
MAINRAQLEQQIQSLGNGGESQSSMADNYIAGLRGVDRSPVSYKEVKKRADELYKYFPQPRQPSIYDLASSLARGIAQNAQSARPTALGYGLGLGFDLFNQQFQKRREEADKMRREMMLLARQEVEKEKSDDIRLQEAGLEAAFKLQLEKLKLSGSGVFQGKGDLASALNYILRAQADPSLKFDENNNLRPEYAFAKALVERPTPRVVQTDQGSVVVQLPGLNVDQILGESTPSSQASSPAMGAPQGFTDTGRTTSDGRRIFQDPNGSLVVEQ